MNVYQCTGVHVLHAESDIRFTTKEFPFSHRKIWLHFGSFIMQPTTPHAGLSFYHAAKVCRRLYGSQTSFARITHVYRCFHHSIDLHPLVDLCFPYMQCNCTLNRRDSHITGKVGLHCRPFLRLQKRDDIALPVKRNSRTINTALEHQFRTFCTKYAAQKTFNTAIESALHACDRQKHE